MVSNNEAKAPATNLKTSFKEKAIEAIKCSHYVTAINALIGGSDKARAAYIHILKKKLRLEIRNVARKKGSILHEALNADVIEHFRWETVIELMRSDMPITLEILEGICTTPRTENTAQWSVTFIITYLYTIIQFCIRKLYSHG